MFDDFLSDNSDPTKEYDYLKEVTKVYFEEWSERKIARHYTKEQITYMGIELSRIKIEYNWYPGKYPFIHNSLFTILDKAWDLRETYIEPTYTPEELMNMAMSVKYNEEVD